MSSNRARRNTLLAAATLGVLVVLALVFFCWITPANEEPPSGVSQVQPELPAAPTVERAEPPVLFNVAGSSLPDRHLPAVPVVPLPDPTAPLSVQLAPLVEAAKQGNSVAACRLAFAANRCAARSFMDQFGDTDARSRLTSQGIAVPPAGQDSIEGEREFCAGFNPAQIPTTEVLFEASLAALTPKQKTMLAMMLSQGDVRRLTRRFKPGRPAETVLPQFIADHTVEFLQAGFSAREPLALEGLILLYAPSSMVRAQGVMPRLPDHRRFLGYALLQRRLFGPQALGRDAHWIMELVARSTPPEILDPLNAEVEAEAQRWARAYGIGELTPDQTLPAMPDIEDPMSACDG